MADRDVASLRTFTLAEVRALGRFAWKEDYLFADGRILRIVAIPEANGSNRVQVRPTSLQDDEPQLRQGWRHVNGCSCSVCSEEQAGS